MGHLYRRMPSLNEAKPASQPASHPNLVLAICCMSLLLVSMDVTIVNVALPVIERELHASLAQLQWIIDAYTLVVASLLLLAGSISDRVGRRRIFQIGLTVFSLGSLLCSLAPNIETLIAFRAVQGLGASMLNPVALSIVANVFPDPKARARAVGVWGAVAGVSLAAGPLLGGVLTQTVGWRAIFWVNLPIGLAAILLAAKYVPESKAPKPRGLDPIGQALVFCTLASVTYAVIEGPRMGWHSAVIVGLFVVAAILVVAFVGWELRRKTPLIDLRFFRSVPFSSATVIALLAFSSFAGFLFLNALYLQQVRGLSPFHTGLSTLPVAAMLVVCATLSGRLVASHGPRPSLLLTGAAFMVSSLMLTGLSPQTPIVWLLVAYAVFGIGLGMVNPAVTNSAVAGMPLSQAGVAAAIASTGRQVGAALGVAITGTVVSGGHRRGAEFTHATHAIWWAICAVGAVIFALGLAAGTRWAKTSTERVAALLKAEEGT